MPRVLPGDPQGGPDDPPEGPDNSTRQRILAATAEVLGRNGMSKLSLSQVATEAGGVSRPTLYRYFADKRELLDVFVVWERHYYEHAIAAATAGLPAHERLDAALRVIVEYQLSYPGLRMVDIEPDQVIKRMARVLPLMRERLQRLCTVPTPRYRPRPRYGWRSPSTWCAAMTAQTSWPSCATRRASNTTRRHPKARSPTAEPLTSTDSSAEPAPRAPPRCAPPEFRRAGTHPPRRAGEVGGRGDHRHAGVRVTGVRLGHVDDTPRRHGTARRRPRPPAS